MIRFFSAIYSFLEARKFLLYSSLIAIWVVAAYLASGIDFEEDISSFMPQTKDSETITKVFKNIKVKDKITLIVSLKDSLNSDTQLQAEVCDRFIDSLIKSPAGIACVKSVTSRIDADFVSKMQDYVYDNLPIFLDSADYSRIEAITTPQALDLRMEENRNAMYSPLSTVTKKIIVKDPLGLGSEAMRYFADLQIDADYTLINDHIYSTDGRYLLALISPVYGAGNIADNKPLTEAMQNLSDYFGKQYPQAQIDYFGGLPVAAANASIIKSDSILSGILVTIVVGLVIVFAFGRKRSVPLIILPVLFGGTFALALMYLLQGSISLIAIGAGSAVMGIALSYSIHVFCHSLHAKSAQEVITDLAYPMTIGSFTTVGGFLGLTFCSSEILRDFGLFSSLTLAGTTIFCLIYLPHFLDFKPRKPKRLMVFIEKINSVSYHRYTVPLLISVLLVVGSLFFAGNVKFNSDMMKISYVPQKLAQAEQIINNIFNEGELKTIFFVSSGSNVDEAVSSYKQAAEVFEKLRTEGLIDDYATAQRFIIPLALQQSRIEQWNNYWTVERKQNLTNSLNTAAQKHGFKPEAFNPFLSSIDKHYEQIDYGSDYIAEILGDKIEVAPEIVMAITQVRIADEHKNSVYEVFANQGDIVILDKPYFASKLAGVVNDDFSKVLYIVSILVFVTIFISYGRIELTLITFLPMAASWLIILGLMGLLGIEFNIINIILSTFIFGIGDDFSIFVTDGLLSEYRYKRKMLAAHKTAIFFSAFTVMVGLGAMVFSAHPALRSISSVSIIGMLAVVFIAYTLQPFIFNLLISGRTAAGKFPHTWYSIFVTFVSLTYFSLGGILLGLLSYLLLLIPSAKLKKRLFHALMFWFSSSVFWLMQNVKIIKRNPLNENFDKPALIIANHQSVIDILQMLSLNKKIVMVTKSWVVNSPIFGRAVRFAGFVNIDDGYEKSIESLRKSMSDGYSVVVFPEGSRSADCKIHRFRKGVFYLAEQLKADIVPIMLHGGGQIMSKNDIFYLKDGVAASEILPRIAYDDKLYGENYSERCKNIARMFREKHADFVREIDENNKYYRYKLIKNYTYKGPVLEWYLRIKFGMEGGYNFFENLVPYNAKVTDLGCGYGFLAYMLAFKSDQRLITGVDYDDEKIETAKHNFSRTANLSFFTADAVSYVQQPSDVFILNDMLHYLNAENRRKLLDNCVEKLNDGGIIIIRDGDKSNKRKHKTTKLSEKFSTDFISFNKTEGGLDFMSSAEIHQFACDNGLKITSNNKGQTGSNIVFVLSKI